MTCDVGDKEPRPYGHQMEHQQRQLAEPLQSEVAQEMTEPLRPEEDQWKLRPESVAAAKAGPRRDGKEAEPRPKKSAAMAVCKTCSDMRSSLLEFCGCAIKGGAWSASGGVSSKDDATNGSVVIPGDPDKAESTPVRRYGTRP